MNGQTLDRIERLMIDLLVAAGTPKKEAFGIVADLAVRS